MQIWVDGDACPNVIKDVLFRAAIRTQINLIFVANQVMTIPNSPYIKKITVSSGFDVADNTIIAGVFDDDLVITADIPLANAVIEKGAVALNPRGKLYSKDNIKEILTLRNFTSELRDSGIITSGPAKLTTKEIQKFANSLDQYITKYLQKNNK